ncbi:MAG TPA: SDR family NAD(P)-dependent oxidoreductase, partial [Pyrinomonadaceae bacterium]|nr:SDR family NAD(P)-dependent oxidoreductase [Pyrinomonadaceae bacterium]
MKLKDRIALITGGGRGIGRAGALEVAREGARIIVAARPEAEVSRVAAEIQQGYETVALSFACDVSDKESIERTFKGVAERFGRGVDILVN